MKRLWVDRPWCRGAWVAGAALWLTMPLAVRAAPESSVTIRSLTASPASPAVGRPVTWTASASGGTAPLEYKFLRLDGGAWKTVKDYGRPRAYTWTPSASDLGPHRVAVWVRSAGSAAEWDAWEQTADFFLGATVDSLTSSRAAPRVGLSMTWTAIARGSPEPLQYRFWRLDGDVWVSVRDYGASNVWSWVPGSGDAGKHAMIVWVRTAGSANPHDVWFQSAPFTVAP